MNNKINPYKRRKRFAMRENIIWMGMLLLILSIVSAGCTSSTPSGTVSPTPQIIYVTVTSTPAPSLAPETSTLPTTLPATTPTESLIYTSDQINKHFVDIVFGNDISTINKYPNTLVKDDVTGDFTASDINLLSIFQQQFNEYSSTTQLSNAPIENEQGSIIIDFLPESSLQNLAMDTSYTSTLGKQIINKDSSGNIASIYRTAISQSSPSPSYTPLSAQTSVIGNGVIGTIYVNSDMTGDERTHFIIRGLLYYLGFVGQTGTYPDSIFYSGQNNTTTPDLIDWDAISLMYGNTITSGMNLTQVENTLLILNTNS